MGASLDWMRFLIWATFGDCPWRILSVGCTLPFPRSFGGSSSALALAVCMLRLFKLSLRSLGSLYRFSWLFATGRTAASGRSMMLSRTTASLITDGFRLCRLSLGYDSPSSALESVGGFLRAVVTTYYYSVVESCFCKSSAVGLSSVFRLCSFLKVLSLVSSSWSYMGLGRFLCKFFKFLGS